MPSSKAPEVLRELRIVDADTHITEPHDMWTSRAPKGFEDRVPRVVNGDDGPQWVVDGAVLGRAAPRAW
ncbi:hypothetical protein ACFQU9_15095 [Actinomadura namibiensis]|uniref:hypothetical protein n=1 Tax=Actinomadura kijaniata TaxID=46161 RepID=UPI003610726B